MKEVGALLLTYDNKLRHTTGTLPTVLQSFQGYLYLHINFLSCVLNTLTRITDNQGGTLKAGGRKQLSKTHCTTVIRKLNNHELDNYRDFQENYSPVACYRQLAELVETLPSKK